MSKILRLAVAAVPLLVAGLAHATEVAEVACKSASPRFVAAAVLVDHAGHAVVAGGAVPGRLRFVHARARLRFYGRVGLRFRGRRLAFGDGPWWLPWCWGK